MLRFWRWLFWKGKNKFCRNIKLGHRFFQRKQELVPGSSGSDHRGFDLHRQKHSLTSHFKLFQFPRKKEKNPWNDHRAFVKKLLWIQEGAGGFIRPQKFPYSPGFLLDDKNLRWPFQRPGRTQVHRFGLAGDRYQFLGNIRSRIKPQNCKKQHQAEAYFLLFSQVLENRQYIRETTLYQQVSNELHRTRFRKE